MQTVIKQIQIICFSVYDWALHKFERWLLWMGHRQTITKLIVSFLINSVQKVWTSPHISTQWPLQLCHVVDSNWHFRGSPCLHHHSWDVPWHLKGKAVPLQAWSGPQGSRKLRFPDFVTMAQEGGKVVSLMHRPPLPPGNTPGTHFC